jgi:hypothetical protein
MGEFTRRVVPPREPGMPREERVGERVGVTGRPFTVETVGGPRATPSEPWRGVPETGTAE